MSYSSDSRRADAYQALRVSDEFHRAALSSISDAVFLLDDKGVFRYIYPNVEVIFGYALDELYTLGNIGRLLGEDVFDEDELIAQAILAENDMKGATFRLVLPMQSEASS